MLDCLIKNASIIDGTGSPAYKGNLGIKDGKIVFVKGDEEAAEVIDAAGRCLTPGFIDAHSHGDTIIGSKDHALYKVTQGVTTDVGGQCGLSMAPVTSKNLYDSQVMLAVTTPEFPEDMVNWTSYPRYLEYVDALPKVHNTMMYVGHSTLRIAVMGMDNRKPTSEELESMKSLLKEAMEAGAAGFSTGLIYTPCCYAEEDEIVELAKVIAPYNGIYASHMRDESTYVVESVKETINVGRRAGVIVDISHHKMLGKPNWGKQKETLRLIHEANEEGIRTICDQYPFTRNMTSLNACIPPWHFADGFVVMTEKLKDPDFRAQLKKEIEDPATEYDNYYLNTNGWTDILVCTASLTPEAEGKTVAEYAELIGKDPWEAFFDICEQNKCATCAVYASMCDDDVCEIIRDPYCVVGSDGIGSRWEIPNHPRASATFPHAINYFVKDMGILSLEEAVHKMTGLTADYLGIKNKGFIKEGYDADLVIFDFDKLEDTASYSGGNGITEGIDYVIVAGEVVYHDKQFTGRTPGVIIRHNS